MKKKLLALVCALVMIFSLASCGLSTPDTVARSATLKCPPACICWPSSAPISRLPSWLARTRTPLT